MNLTQSPSSNDVVLVSSAKVILCSDSHDTGLILMTSWINKGEGGRKSLLRMQSKLERKINKPNCDTDREDSDGGDAHQDPNICHFEADAREVDDYYSPT
ncbi:hypothetical protein Tco_0151674 [Tanacetum coccineum]